MGFTLPEEARGAVYLILHDDNDPEGDLETILMLTEEYDPTRIGYGCRYGI